MDKLKACLGLPKILIALTFLPAVFIAVLILLAGVNVPILDQWELAPIIQHVHGGHFLWSDFWLQHNEHRIFFPQLLMLASALITHWNTMVECLIGLVIAVASFGIILKLLKQVKLMNYWLVGLLSLIWFSPVQLENWLWGWQMQWFMNVLGAILVAFGLTKIKDRRLPNSYLAMILAGAILAQYSLGNGTLLWPLIIAVLIYKRAAWRQTGLVTLIGLVTSLFYFRNYVDPTVPSKALALSHPLSYVDYVLTYLGRPLTFFHHLTALFGFAALALFVWLNIHLFRNKRSLFDNKVLPWTLLGLYAVGSALITGIARLGLGVDEAYSSRYTTISSLLMVGLLVSVFASRNLLAKHLGHAYKVLAPAFIAGALFLIAANFAWGIHASIGRHRELEHIKQCTELFQPSVDCLSLTYPNQQIVEPRLNYLKQIHWAGY